MKAQAWSRTPVSPALGCRQQGPCGFQSPSVYRAGPEPDAANTVGPSLPKKGRKEGKKRGNIEKKEEKNLKTSTAEIKKTHQMGNRIS